MRSIEELERAAFRETLTAEEDDRLAALFVQRAADEANSKKIAPDWKQATYFASRAFDNGMREPAMLAK